MLKSNSLPISYLSKNLIHFLFPVLSKSFKRNLSLISLDATVNRLVKSQF